MINIELTTEHAAEIKNFYVCELAKLQKRAVVIRELLSLLGAERAINPVKENKENETTEAGKSKPAKPEKTKEIPAEDETKIKNPKWRNFIIEVLHEKEKPLSRKVIMKLYSQRNNVKLTDSKSARTSLEKALFKLRVKDKKIESIKKKGKKEALYGLIEWAGKFSVKTPKERIKKTKKDNTAPPVEIIQKPLPDSEYNWTQFIQETIISEKRILSVPELIQYAFVKFELTEEYRKAIRNRISLTISELKQSKILKPAKKEGVDGLSYGPSEWFSDDGYIKPEYNRQKKSV